MFFSFGSDPRQQMEIENVRREFMKICESHPGCEGCPLKTSDMTICNSNVRCNTGRGDIK